ncbi:hypothetical protein [Pseudooceanicola algae]|uniref:Uncharacterized protein n=1 Tax=Pseudooceanicola algae TaxID=1537215 RepID=A0A418SJ25_9RHOB|nr:hypothetical protein [Pseudooceanicola algae]QPM91986.1 hypothetical protein PSAL_032490 [Pseudooceanicola algae]
MSSKFLCACTLALTFSLSPGTMLAETVYPVLASCYRGPWEDVIWDKANPEFMETLMQNGITPDAAEEIGERVCRDPALVGKPDLIIDRTRELMRLASGA